MITKDVDRFGPPAFVTRTPLLRGTRVEGRPISRHPPDNTVTVMFRRTGDKFVQCGVGVFKDGCWKNDKRKPLEGDLYWTALVDER